MTRLSDGTMREIEKIIGVEEHKRETLVPVDDMGRFLYYARSFSRGDVAKIQKEFVVTDIGKYSLSTSEHAMETINAIGQFIHDGKDNYTMIDGSAGMGGNLIPMMYHFKQVIGYEIDPVRFSALSKNVNLYKSTKKPMGSVVLLNESIVNFTKREESKLAKSILFLDPPWGGPGYKNVQHINLFFDNTPVSCVIKEAFKNNIGLQLVCMKAPFNYFVHDLVVELPRYFIYEKLIYKRNGDVLYKLIFLSTVPKTREADNIRLVHAFCDENKMNTDNKIGYFVYNRPYYVGESKEVANFTRSYVKVSSIADRILSCKEEHVLKLFSISSSPSAELLKRTDFFMNGHEYKGSLQVKQSTSYYLVSNQRGFVLYWDGIKPLSAFDKESIKYMFLAFSSKIELSKNFTFIPRVESPRVESKTPSKETIPAKKISSPFAYNWADITDEELKA